MPKQFSITRRLEIDAAHRVPDHQSKCFNIHGHRYVIEATCVGDVFDEGEQKGMVMDFGFLKECMITTIHNPCDHGAIFYRADPMFISMDGTKPGWKLYIIDSVPTAENLAKIWYGELTKEIGRFFKSRLVPIALAPELVSITVWETPNCKATYPW